MTLKGLMKWLWAGCGLWSICVPGRLNNMWNLISVEASFFREAVSLDPIKISANGKISLLEHDFCSPKCTLGHRIKEGSQRSVGGKLMKTFPLFHPWKWLTGPRALKTFNIKKKYYMQCWKNAIVSWMIIIVTSSSVLPLLLSLWNSIAHNCTVKNMPPLLSSISQLSFIFLVLRHKLGTKILYSDLAIF